MRPRAPVLARAALGLALLLAAAEGACPNLCSGHGLCDNPSSVCSCFPGFFGADCSLRQCPTARVWAERLDGAADDPRAEERECSGRGLCSYDAGECTCFAGWTGHACHRLDCRNRCNERGTCMTMTMLNTFYGRDAAPGETGDGVVPDYLNWEGEALSACFCDWGYTGPDCSIKMCPKGDDPRTPYQQVRARPRAPAPTLDPYEEVREGPLVGRDTLAGHPVRTRTRSSLPRPRPSNRRRTRR